MFREILREIQWTAGANASNIKTIPLAIICYMAYSMSKVISWQWSLLLVIIISVLILTGLLAWATSILF